MGGWVVLWWAYMRGVVEKKDKLLTTSESTMTLTARAYQAG